MTQRMIYRRGLCILHVSSIAVVLMLAASSVRAAPVDLTGVWDRWPPLHTPAPNPGAIFTEEGSANARDLSAGPRLKEPYATQYKEFERLIVPDTTVGDRPIPKILVRKYDGLTYFHSYAGCGVPSGVPTMMEDVLPMEIVSRRGELLIVAEEEAEIRRIYLNAKMPPVEDIPPTFDGYSVGHWEGDTLVVETAGIRDDARYLDIPHSSAMKVIERIRLTSPEMLQDRFTIEDPKYLVEPYRFTYRYKRDLSYKLQEYDCDDDHYYANQAGVLTLGLEPPKKAVPHK